MVNHVRTILLNESPSNKDYLGYEYVPTQFTPINLHSSLQPLYLEIFGEEPTASSKSILLSQILTCAHSNKVLKDAIYAFDKRVTYSTPYVRNDNYQRGIKDVIISADSVGVFTGLTNGEQLTLVYYSGPTYAERVAAVALGLAGKIQLYRNYLGV